MTSDQAQEILAQFQKWLFVHHDNLNDENRHLADQLNHSLGVRYNKLLVKEVKDGANKSTVV